MINSLKNLSEEVLKMPSISHHTCSQPFSNPQNCFINGVLGKTVPYFLQHIFEFSFCVWLWPVLLIGSKHNTQTQKSIGLRSGVFGGHATFPILCYITLYNSVHFENCIFNFAMLYLQNFCTCPCEIFSTCCKISWL